MGFSESDSSKCRRHPNPKQLPGVCSSCLKEQLSKLSISSSSFNNKRTNFISSDNSSSASASSTATSRSRHRRNGSELSAYVSVGLVLNNGLKKSRSVSCAPLSSRSCREKFVDGKKIINNNKNNNSNSVSVSMRKSNYNNNYDNDGEEGEKNKNAEKIEEDIIKMNSNKKGGGFLKRLIHSTSKKTKGVLMHSKTIKETSPPPPSSSNITSFVAHN